MCRDAGFDELVTKPMSFDHLAKTLGKFAHGSERQPPPD
jgi:hypothetical protein